MTNTEVIRMDLEADAIALEGTDFVLPTADHSSVPPHPQVLSL